MTHQLTPCRQLLEAAHKAWAQMEEFRLNRDRCKRFTYGSQWDDPITTPDGRITSERELAEMAGRKPLTNNLIRQMLKSVVGRFRQLRRESPVAPALRDAYENNSLGELDARALEEFLISGCAVQKVSLERRGGSYTLWVDNVNPAKFFVNTLADPRCRDVEIVGMLHDMSLQEVVMRFSHGSPRRAAAIRGAYANSIGMASSPSSFFHARSGRCRIIEVWTLECYEHLDCHDRANGTLSTRPVTDLAQIEAENHRRRSEHTPEISAKWNMSTQWRCRFLTPEGLVLDTTLSPYPHKSHPFVLKLYPLTDGEVHPFVEDILDQQKHINRLVTMIDHIIGSSAKGILLFPTMQKPKEVTWEEVGRQWARCDGILPYDPKPGEPQPQQIITNNSDLGAYQLLNLEMKLFEDISGVSETLMGKATSATRGSSMYESQVRNATIALADILDTFSSFLSERDRKLSF